MAELVRYDAMCRAIAEAYTVDEVKDIHDKALAIEAYARQAHNTEAERQACEIRLRAERRAGQLSRELPSAQGHRSDLTSFPGEKKSEALERANISPTQAARWEKLAAIPEADFEATFARDEKPSTKGIIREHEAKQNKQPAVNPNALWLWGRLLDFERQGILRTAPEYFCETMLPHMKETVRELAPQVASWLKGLNP